MTLLVPAMIGILAAVSPRAADSVVVGVLEKPQCKEGSDVAVRALFVKLGREWVALSSQEAWQAVSLASATWTVAFDGRSLGSVKSVDPGFRTDDAWTFPRDRLLSLVPGQSVPRVINKDGGFAGWCTAPNLRPLVVVSVPSTQDPDAWKRFRPGNALRARLFEAFRAEAGPANFCPTDSDAPVPLIYDATDLEFSSSYQAKAGARLVALRLDPRRNTCDGPGESAWATHSFLLDGGTQYLGADLSLVDAGDYDGDGASELLFWFSGYNEDGYTLFYDGLRKHVNYRWGYH